MLIDAVFPAASEVVMVYAGAIAVGRVRRPVGDALRLRVRRAASPRTSRWRSPGRSATSSVDRRLRLGDYLGRPWLEQHGRWLHLDAREARPRGALVRPLGGLGGLPRTGHAGRSGRSSRSPRASSAPLRAVRVADAARLGDLVLRLRRRRLGGGRELGELPRGVPLRRLRRRVRRDRRRRGGSCGGTSRRRRGPADEPV